MPRLERPTAKNSRVKPEVMERLLSAVERVLAGEVVTLTFDSEAELQKFRGLLRGGYIGRFYPRLGLRTEVEGLNLIVSGDKPLED